MGQERLRGSRGQGQGRGPDNGGRGAQLVPAITECDAVVDMEAGVEEQTMSGSFITQYIVRHSNICHACTRPQTSG